MYLKNLLLALAMLLALPAVAQDRKIMGMLIDADSKEPVIQASVQLLNTDSSYVAGAVSNAQGVFVVKAPKDKLYLLRISSVGYQTIVKRVKMEDMHNLEMGKLQMKTDVVMLKGAKVVAQAVRVTVKEDTFIYNSAAYRTPEGSTIEELVKRLPGVTVDEDGKIMHNGKQVKKILVDGKEFMTGDTKVAMKNLPTSIVEKVKAYEEKSDLARITGIDDGEETTVLDFGLKRGMNKGMFSNIDLALGTKNRYAEKLMGAMFNDRNRFMLFANANNVNDAGFPGGGGRAGMFGRSQGLNAAKMLGFNYNYEIKDKLKVDFSGNWRHSAGDALSVSSAETFVSTVVSFSNSRRQNYTRSDAFTVQGRMEWKIDSMTTLTFRPNASWTKNDGLGASVSASFNEDPYLKVKDPLDEASLELLGESDVVVNSQNGNSITFSQNDKLGGNLMLNRKLGSKGRNVTIGFNGNYSKSDSESLSANATHLWLKQAADGQDSTYQTNRYNLTPTDNYSYKTTATYSEPLFKGAVLQFRDSFTYSHSKSDRSTYDFSKVGAGFFDSVHPEYRGWGGYLSMLPNDMGSYLDSDLSKYSEYDNYTHELNVTFRLIRQKYRLNAGFMIQPQRSKFVQDYQGKYVDTTRTVTNFSPTLDFRYRFNKQHQLRLRYRGTTAQPSMTQLLDIVDDSNPLNISMGNPGLKPSFTNRLDVHYNNFIQKRTQAIGANLSMQTIRNSISNRVTYDAETGGRITRPENINGNWNINGGAFYNTSLATLGRWFANVETKASFDNSVSYLTLDKTTGVQKNRTQTLGLDELLGVGYRNDWLEVELNGSMRYTHGRNKLQSQSNLDTWQFTYGTRLTINAPWGTSLSTGLTEQSRRGYNDASMNTNELIWNAQVSQGFLKGKPLTVMIQFYDLLHQQSNFSRTLNALQRSDTWYNSINSYVMLHVVYRLNLFGGKDARQEMQRARGGDRPDFEGHGGRRPAGGFRNSGGFGGGRSGGQGGFGGGRF